MSDFSWNDTNELETLDEALVKKAIRKYISDINNYPLYYDVTAIEKLKQESFVTDVIDKYNLYYQVGKAKSYSIPYNQIAQREIIALKLEDRLIRYILYMHLYEKTSFVPSAVKYTDEYLDGVFKREISINNKVLVKVDIANCYETICHSTLIKLIAENMQLKDSSTYLTVLKSALKVIYESEDLRLLQKQEGLIIGCKCDEYFAEFFLDHIEKSIISNVPSVFRIADEFHFFAENIYVARIYYNRIVETLSEYGLSLNKAKTRIVDLREKDILKQDFQLNKIKSAFITGSRPHYKPSEFILTKTTNTTTLASNKTSFNNNGLQLDEHSSSVDTYEDAIAFLKYLASSKDKIKQYQDKYPEYKYFYNIAQSQPTDFLNDYYDIDFALLSKENIATLKKIIYYYPKSEYYTAMALQLLVFAAVNSIHITSEYDNDTEGIDMRFTETCEAANITILEILSSVDIHPYQKYILIRTLFKNRNDLDFRIENYTIQKIHYYESPDPSRNIKFTLPFSTEVLKTVKKISTEEDYFPLKMLSTFICNKHG